MREVADARVHGTTGELPIERFRAKEATALRPLQGRTTFQPIREMRWCDGRKSIWRGGWRRFHPDQAKLGN